jgi:hypothetical protein
MKLYWRAFNLLARFVGIGFVLSGLILIAFGAGDISSERVVGIVAGAVVVAFGVGLVVVRAYRPDLGDSAWHRSTQQRTWLTGDPKNQAAA